jgi:hypothetical protein
MPADANPLVVIDVVFLHGSVQHQILSVLFQITQRAELRVYLMMRHA